MFGKKEKSPVPMVASSFALGFIVLFLVVYVLKVASGIFIPFMIALFLWYLINAIARGLGRIEIGGRPLPRFLCFTLSILSLCIGMWFIYAVISDNAAKVVHAAPAYQKNFAEALPKLKTILPEAMRPSVASLTQEIDIGHIITRFAAMFTGIAGQTLIVLFYTGFLLYEQRFFRRKIDEMITDPETEQRVQRILKNIDVNMQRYIWVKTLISALTGFFTYLALHFWKVDFAEFWGLLAFFLNFIPYVGSLVAVVLPSAIALIQFADPATFLLIVASLWAVQVFFGQFLDPYLTGHSLNLSPIFIISSLAMWGMIWGVPGMFLSIPILAMIVIILSQFPQTRGIAVLLSKTGEIEKLEPVKA